MTDASWQNFTTTNTTEPDCDSDDTFGTASSSAKTTTVVDPTDHGKWVCFRVKNSNNIYGYAKYQVDLQDPVVEIHQVGTKITATSPATDLPTTPVWKKKGPSDTSDCDSNTTLTTGNSFDTTTTNKFYCFSVTDKVGNIGYGEIQIGEAPVVSISQATTTVTASATTTGTLTATSWQNFTTTNTTEPDCDSDDTFGTASSSAKTTTVVDPTDHGKWVCFRVKNSNNIYGYAKYQVDLQDPVVEIHQVGTKITATSPATDLPTTPVWKKKGPSDTSDCDSNTTLTTGNSFDTTTTNKFYCFSVTDKVGNIGYGEIQIGEAPVVSISQATTTVTASATTTGTLTATSWQNFTTTNTTEPDCDSDDTFGTASSSAKTTTVVDPTDHGKWVCFRVKNSNNIYGYAKYQVDLQDPVVEIHQVGTKITATSPATDLPTTPVWKKKGPSDTSDCDSNTTLTTGNSFDTTTTNKFYCFSVTDKVGNIGYGEIQIGEAPVVSISQATTTVTASATTTGTLTATSWQNFTTTNTTEPDCDSDDTFGTASSSAKTTTVVDPTDHGKWVCFRVKNSNNIYGYAKYQVDLQDPVVEIHQVGTKITATSPATDLPTTPVWKKKGPSDTSDCDSNTTLTTGNSFDTTTTNKFYCFSVTDKVGNIGYGEIQIGEAPVVSISQATTTVTASATTTGTLTATSWQNFTTTNTTEPDCDSDDTFGTASSSAKTTTVVDPTDHGKWVCFRVKNSNNIYGYAKYQVDLQDPVVEIHQVGTKITATSPATDLPTTPVWKKKGPSDTSDCDSNTTLTTGNSFDTTTTNKFYCFSVTDKVGNIGYGEIQIGEAPVVSISQATTTVTASATTTGTLTDASWQNFTTTNTTEPDCDSDDTFGTASSSAKTTTVVDPTDHGKWVCFRVKNSNNIYGYAKYQVDLQDPVVEIHQVGTKITATSPATDLPTTPVWKKKGPSDTSDCDSNTTLTTGNSFDTTTTNKFYCFSVTDKVGNIGYGEIQIGEAPVVSISQATTTVTASATTTGTLTATSWQNFTTTNTTEPDCDSDDTFGTASSSAKTTTVVDPTDHGKWVCFRVKNSNNIYGYGKWQVDFTAPTITLTQNNNTIVATGTGLSDFKYFVSTDSTSPTCDSSNTSATYTDGSTTTAMADDRWACFTAKNSNQVWGFAKKQIDLTIPTITLTQNNNTIVATGTGLSDFKYFVSTDSTSPTCSSSVTSGWTDGSTTSAMEDDRWACFTARNSNHVWGFAKKQIDLTIPTITLTQNNNTITASGTGLSDFKYFVSTDSTSPTCDSSNTSATYTDGSTTTAMVDDRWACFTAKNSNQVWGFAKKQIDLTIPTITLTQNNNTIVATGTGLSDFKYFVSTDSTSPTCDSSNTSATYTDGSTTTAMADDRWACFTAKNSNQVWGFAKKQIDLTIPTITLTQNNNTITASGTGLSDFKYFVSTDSTSPTCDSSNTSATYTDGSTTTAMADDRWACFTAKNSNQVWGFAKKQIDLTIPTITLTQNNNTIVATGTGLSDFKYFVSTDSTSPTCSSSVTSGWTDGSTTSAMEDDRWACFTARNSNHVWGFAKKQIDLTIPTITLTQNNNTITASGTGLSDFKYFVSTDSTSPTCDSSNTSATYTDGSTTTAMVDDRWACFTAKNSNQVWGYAKKQIDLTIPTITLTQNNNTIVATGTGLSDFKYFVSTDSTSPTCSSSVTSGWTDGSTTSAMVDDRWACFTAKNSNQVWGFAKKQIDLTIPTITLTQNNNTITASGTGLSGFKYFVSTDSTSPTCSSSVTSGWTDGSTTSAMADDRWACFTAKNSNQVWGFAKKQIDLTIPTITLTQNNNTIVATGTGLSDFKYFVSTDSTSPTCSSSVTSGWTDGSTTTAMVDDRWACFTARNSNHVWGFAKKQIDLTIPTITLTQNNNTIVSHWNWTIGLQILRQH